MSKLIAIVTILVETMALTSATASPNVLQLALQDESRPTITRATDVVNEASPKEVNSGDDVVFSVRVGAEALLRDGFQVRIFTLPALSSTPLEASKAVDDCLIFFSTVYPIAASGGPKVQLISNASEGWLSVKSDGTVGNGYYLLVFEKTGVRESVFRIRRSDAAAYFATGIRLVVRANNKSRLEEVISRNVTREALRNADAAKLVRTDEKVPCYRYEKVTKFAGLIEGPLQLAMLTCTSDRSAS